jgi:predicted NBD/HSP70 family sugar kinase
VPVFVENDVNLAALGEWGFGAGRSVDNLIALAIGTGIGAGIVIDGRLCRGHRYAAGEVGYMLPGLEYLGRRYDGFGALESLAAAPGIAARGRHLAPAGAFEGDVDAEAVFTAARAGCRWALRVVSETVDYLSLAIGNIQALLDPELIVLAGGVARSADLLIPAVLERLEGALAAPPNLVAAELGSHAVAMGGVATVLQRMG